MLVDIRPDHLDLVKRVLQRWVPDQEVWAFGSRAKWTAKDYSDLDLCIVTKAPLSFEVMGHMEEDFAESDLPYKVDLVDWSSVSAAFRTVIERDKVVVQKAARGDVGGMSGEWDWKRLGNHCSKIGSGSTPTGGKDAYLEHGPFMLIRSQNIYNDGFKPGGLAFIGNEQAKKLDGVAVEVGDVLLNITGDSVARVCLALPQYLPARVNQHVAIIRPNPLAFDSRFVRYFLASEYQQNLMLGLAAAGATRNALTKSMIEDFKVPCPALCVQRDIAENLSVLDDRITLLRETNATLEAIAQALFKSWFVDFDPVRAKMEGCAPEGMIDATAALFPDSFEESELGLVPRGWRVGQLGHEVKIAYGKNLPTSKLLASGYPVYGGNGQIGFSDKFLYESRQVLVACRGAASGKFNQSVPRSFVTNNSLVLESSDATPLLFGYLKGCISCADLIPFVTGSAQPQVTIDNLKNFKLLVPSAAVIREFESFSAPIEDAIEANDQQAQTLATLRDTLLPRLISGQLRLPEAQAAAEDALA